MAEQTKQALKVENNTNFPNNNTGFITPALLREFNTDMIDSTVNQISYTADSASFDTRIDGISPVATGSLLVTASAAGNTITFEKGDGSTFDVTTAGGGGDVTALNAYTASNDLRWDYLDTQSGSWAVTGSSVLFTNVTASFFKGDGSQITNVTASFTGVPISNDGVPQGLASTLNFTGSAVNASVIGGIALITVDSIGTASFNSFTQSVDNRLDSLEAATSSYANSASVAAVDLAQQNQINALIASTGSAANLTALNAFTASIAGTNAFTASTILEINSIEAFTSSLAGTNAFTASIRGTNTFTASIAGTNAFTQSTNTSIANINTSISAINGFTASNSTFDINVFTASIKQTNTFTASAQLEINALEAFSASVLGTNTFTASLAGTNVFTASLAGTNAFTQSAQNSLNSLNSATSSFARLNVNNQFTTDQTITGSLVVTGTITANKLNVIIESSSVIYSSGSNQFGDELSDVQILSGSVKVVGGLTVNGLNVVTGASDTTALNQATASLQAFTASVFGTNAFTASIAGTNTFTASIAGTNAFTQSADQRLDSIEAQSGSWVTSAITASSLVTASFSGNTLTFTKGDASTFGVVLPDVSGSAGTTIFETVYTGENITKGDPLYISGSQGASPIVFKADAAVPTKMPVTFVASETIGAANTTNAIVLGLIEGINLTGYVAGQEIYVAEGGGWSASKPSGSNSITQLLGVVTKGGAGGKGLVLNPGPATLPGLDNGNMWVGGATNQPIEISTSSFASSASFNSYTSSTNLFTQSAQLEINALEAFTASIAGTNAFTASTILRLNSIESRTGSFATTGSNAFVGNQTITGSLILSSSAVTELQVIGDVQITGSVLLSSSAAIELNVIGGTQFSGSSVFTGSVQGNVVSMSIASNTASMDFNAGNFFTITLASGSIPTRIEPTNIKAGQTVSLVVTQAGTLSGSLAFPTTFKFPSGSSYVPSAITSSKDIVTFITVDTSTIFASSVKNLI